MKRKNMIALLLWVLVLSVILPVTAYADTGPKPSVRINFENMGDGLCYGTLLSKNASTGPASAWNGQEEDAMHKGNYEYAALDYDTWKAFAEYEDADGYYFLQEAWKVSESKQIAWTYYPPQSFKILLYFPESGTFAVSGICERYAFDSYYTVDMDGVHMDSVAYDQQLQPQRSYDFTAELVSLFARIVITIAIEMAVALLFGFREKKQLLLLVTVNAVTQILLNVLLNVVNYNSGQFAFVAYYIFFELIVFALEAVLYCILMKKVSTKQKKNWFYTLYALLANGVSFGAGMLIAQWLPGIF